MNQESKEKKQNGPKPDPAKGTGDWGAMVKKALEKKKPGGGGPKLKFRKGE